MHQVHIFNPTDISNKRTLDGFFKPAGAKRPKIEASQGVSCHASYRYPVSHLPSSITNALGFAPATEAKVINDQPDLDLLYFQPYIPKDAQHDLFKFLRRELFLYCVQHMIKRGSVETQINTPRYTTVFGVDEASYFGVDGYLLESKTKQSVPKDRYTCRPRPLSQCLDVLRQW